MAIKRYKPEQIVTLLRQIEVAPVSREFWRRRVSARLRAPPRSLECRESPPALLRNTRMMPVFRD